MEVLKNYMNGSWVESKEQQTIDVVNPANQKVLPKFLSVKKQP
jgi:malonate-semialdehyde dehydrogenase (acetylating) / methylmalonate-semialdehyde dehydrogenase